MKKEGIRNTSGKKKGYSEVVDKSQGLISVRVRQITYFPFIIQ